MGSDAVQASISKDAMRLWCAFCAQVAHLVETSRVAAFLVKGSMCAGWLVLGETASQDFLHPAALVSTLFASQACR